MATCMNIDPVDIYRRDKDGDTKLHLAIILGKTDLALFFISKAPGYQCISLKNDLFQSPLHLATITNQPGVVRRLVVAGADVTSRDKEGNTPLHIACREGKKALVKSLTNCITNTEAKQNQYKISYQKIPQDFSISNYDGVTCFHLAGMGRHLGIMEVLVKYNIDVNMKDRKSGRTVLHNACENGDVQLVQFLLRIHTCDSNARASDGKTPYEIARGRGHEDICLALAAADSGESFL